jgi:hypothetical protein
MNGPKENEKRGEEGWVEREKAAGWAKRRRRKGD